jgi:transcriptional regulator with GAF, ATPase, and Fis domain
VSERIDDDPTVALLGSLARGFRDVATRRALVRRASEVLSASARLVAFEIRTPSLSGWTHRMERYRIERGETEEDLRAPATSRAADGMTAESAISVPPDAEAQELGASRVVVIPLTGLPERGVAILYLEAARAPAIPWRAVARLLELAVVQCAMIERLATGSRQVNEERRRLRSEVEVLTGGPDIISRSSTMRAARTRIDLVAVHDTTVLLCGESGTGKELFARRLHARSSRRRGPFVAVNCGALPENLVESDLFGHEKGAFTGATSAHKGRFERAHGGTLFLDEVAELPLAQQVKLLRALQEGEIERVGGSRTIKVDPRVVAATHRDLASLVSSGEFREDLFWRIDVFRVELPPLRERLEDLPSLVHALLESISVRMSIPVSNVGPGDIERLAAHTWPGNVRELASVLEESVILGREDRLRIPHDLGARSARRGEPERRPRQASSFAEASRSAIRAALDESGGKIYGADGAAAILELNPTTLQSKMKRLGV